MFQRHLVLCFSCSAFFHPAIAMARLEQVIVSIVDMFVEYADDNGKNLKINKDKFKMLLEKEIQNSEIKVRHSTHPLTFILYLTHSLVILLLIQHSHTFHVVNSKTLFSRLKLVQLTLTRSLGDWIKTTMAR